VAPHGSSVASTPPSRLEYPAKASWISQILVDFPNIDVGGRIYGGIDEGDWVRPDRRRRQGAVIG